MANVKFQESFNPIYKKQFLSYLKHDKKYADGTIKDYSSKLRSFGYFERLWNKDLFDITFEDLQKILFSIETNYRAIRVKGDLIVRYLEWAFETKLRTENIEFLSEVDTEFYRKLSQPFFYTKEQIVKIVKEFSFNIQEKLIVFLIFEGVDDTNGYYELRNLKITDFDENDSSLILYNSEKSSPRKLKISSDTAQCLIDSFLTDNYSGEVRTNISYINSESGHLLRNMLTNTKDIEMVDSFSINRTFQRIKKKGNLKHFDGQLIRKSGMLFLAKQLWEEKRKLGKDEFDYISEIFNEKSPYVSYHIENTIEINLDNVSKFYDSVNKYEGMFDTNNIWKIKEENGKKGEEIVFSHLRINNPKMLFRKPLDFEGYDIEGYIESRERKKIIRNIQIRAEVKTVIENGNSFFISINELIKSRFFGEMYDLYIVRIYNEESNSIFKINNPILYFGINVSELERRMEINNAFLEIASIKIYIKEEELEQFKII